MINFQSLTPTVLTGVIITIKIKNERLINQQINELTINVQKTSAHTNYNAT